MLPALNGLLALFLFPALQAPQSTFRIPRVGLLGSPEPVPARLWIVDAAGGGDFSDLQPALDAARDGDAILLRSDLVTEVGYRLRGKGLTIAGDGGRRSIVLSSLTSMGRPLLDVRRLGSGQDLVLRDLTLQSDAWQSVPLQFVPVLGLEDTSGTVWIEDCSIALEAFLGVGDTLFGITATRCASLVLLRTDFAFPPQFRVSFFQMSVVPGGAALLASSSTVHAFECDFRGHNGGDGNGFLFNVGGDGGDGLRLEDASFLFAQGCAFQGGDGGAASQLGGGCVPPGTGGTGLTVPLDSEAHCVACTFLPGAGGAGVSGVCEDPGPAGSPTGPASGMGLFEDWPGSVRSYAVSSPGTAGGCASLTITGPAGDLVLSLIGTGPACAYLPQHLGSQLVAAPLVIVNEGLIPSEGVLAKSVALPSLPSSLAFASTFRQGFFFDDAGQAFLSSGSSLLILR